MKKVLYAIILAGGSGLRMDTEIPKQFLEIGGKPVLRRTIENFMALGDDVRIIVVLPKEQKEYWKNYCSKSGFLQKYIMPSGGITRFHSVQNALVYVPDGAIVAVHDGVRPFASTEFIRGMIEGMGENCGVIPAVAPVDSMRILEENGRNFPVDRSRYRMVQTPQIFRSEILKEAYRQPYDPSFTDDSSVVEAAGYKVELVEGSRMNIKLTTPYDLSLAEAICSLK